MPIAGVVSDGQHSIRKAVAEALAGVPHQLCQFHYLREAARPIYEADRHAKVQLKKKVRGIRPIERQVEGRDDAEAEVIRGYCAAVRSALTDDGRPPLEASGLKLQDRLAAIAASLDRVAAKGAPEGADAAAGDPGARAWRRPRRCGRTCGWPSAGSTGRPRSSATRRGSTRAGVRRRYRGLLGAIARHRRAVRRPGRGGGPLPEGDAELLAGAVRLLRRGGPAADEQRPGAVLRLLPLPRAAVPAAGRWRARGWWCGARCGWWRRRRRGCGRSRRPTWPRRTSPRGGPAGRAGAAAGGPDAGPPLPPRPRGLPAIA